MHQIANRIYTTGRTIVAGILTLMYRLGNIPLGLDVLFWFEVEIDYLEDFGVKLDYNPHQANITNY